MDRRSNFFIRKGERTTLGRGVKPLLINPVVTPGVVSEDKFTITYDDPLKGPTPFLKSQIVTGIQNLRNSPQIDLTLPGKNTPVASVDPPQQMQSETTGGSVHRMMPRMRKSNLPTTLLGKKNSSRNNIKLIL
jgi:hypothetical protein